MRRGHVLAFCVVTSLPLVASPAQRQGGPTCLSYESSTVRLTGTIVREKYPGPPNYESRSGGDTEEVYWVLVLRAPVCVDHHETDADLHPAHQGVRKIQLVFSDPGAYKTYEKLVGKSVVARGSLFSSHTGHHHTPVLLTVSTLKKAR